MIPILMYTSQEGELYLGQARALGAVGVLPKQIQPTDVSKVLYQLHLVPDRRTTEQNTFRPVVVEPHEEEPPRLHTGVRPLTETVLREHVAELRRVLVASLDSQSDRLTGDLRMLLEETLPAGAVPRKRSVRTPQLVAAAALLLATVAVLGWYRAATTAHTLTLQLERLQRALVLSSRESAPGSASASPAALASSGQPGPVQTAGTPSGTQVVMRRSAAPVPARPIIEAVPFGADPFGGPRLEALRQLFDRLAMEHFRGSVEIRTFPGRFCLTGNSVDGFSLAPDDTAFAKCDTVGNGGAADDALMQPGRMSVALANLIDELRSDTRGAIDVQVMPGDASSIVAAYPPISDALTAGEWNRAGAANNRIEIRLH
jgi:hypothetical protein